MKPLPKQHDTAKYYQIEVENERVNEKKKEMKCFLNDMLCRICKNYDAILL